MASLPIDPTFARQAPYTPKPNIRVVFLPGPAQTAMAGELAKLPAETQEATLEELEDKCAGLPLRNLLIERNAISEKLNTDMSLSEDAVRAACIESDRLERTITTSPAATADDAIVKLIVLAQITAMGSQVEDTEASQAITEARKHFGIGYTPLETAQPWSPTPITLPQGYDPFMRGPFIQWQRAYEAYAAAKVERRIYEADVYNADGSFRSDEDSEAKQARFDDLMNTEYDALLALIRCTAPGPAELATKMKLFQEYQMWSDSDPAALMAVITADARRFGQHGAHVQTDQNIIAAFNGLRRQMRESYDRDDMTSAEEDSYFARLSAYEHTLMETRATTIEGVIAKMRLAFGRVNQTAWSDHALMDPASADFRDGLKTADPFERMAWGAIEDLARIGGVSLTEVRA